MTEYLPDPTLGQFLPPQFEYEFARTIRGPKTREQYLRIVAHFLRFLKDQGIHLSSPGQLERIHVMRYQEYLEAHGGGQGKGAAPKTIIAHLAALKKFSHFLMQKNILSFDLTAGVPRPRDTAVRPTESLTPLEVKRLFLALDSKKKSYFLHKALLGVVFGTGMRRMEILKLKVKDYQQTTVQGGPSKDALSTGVDELISFFRYRNKGGKFTVVRLHPTISQSIEEYLRWRQKQEGNLLEEDPLFCPTKNPHSQNLHCFLSPWALNSMLKSLAKKAGIEKNISPHVGKKTAINTALNAGIDLWQLAQFAQHSDVRVTQKYLVERNRLLDNEVINVLPYLLEENDHNPQN